MVRHPLEKSFPWPPPPPHPLEITAFEPPSPSEFPMVFRGGGGGMDIFWNHTIQFQTFTTVSTLHYFVLKSAISDTFVLLLETSKMLSIEQQTQTVNKTELITDGLKSKTIDHSVLDTAVHSTLFRFLNFNLSPEKNRLCQLQLL